MRYARKLQRRNQGHVASEDSADEHRVGDCLDSLAGEAGQRLIEKGHVSIVTRLVGKVPQFFHER